MAGTTDYENAWLNLIKVFHKAMDSVMSDDPEEARIRAENEAFAMAKMYGWDWENDDEWAFWGANATEPEIVAHGLAKAIQKIRL